MSAVTTKKVNVMLDHETLPLEVAPFLDIFDPDYSIRSPERSGGLQAELVRPHALWFGSFAL